MEVVSLAAIIAALLSTTAISILPNFILFAFPSFLSSDNVNARNALSLGEALAAGALLGDVFLHTLPHAFMENVDEMDHIGIYILIGFTTFYVMDQLIQAMNSGHSHHHHHDHKEKQYTSIDPPICKESRLSSSILLNLTGDSLHNFTDGLAIGASFTASALSTTNKLHSSTNLISAVLYLIQQSGGLVSLSVMFHEIPHEIGDFSILLMNGTTKKQAILAQFSTAITAFLGTLVGLCPLILPGHGLEAFQHVMIPFTAGGFLYLAAVTIIPDLMQYNNTLVHMKSLWIMLQFLFFVCGIGFMHIVATMEQHDHHHHDHHEL